ncbi:MAG: diguanylate cyclase [Planctomycetes bacterium]|nr:diguanylate cyclase [Planctomycetota bacterium]
MSHPLCEQFGVDPAQIQRCLEMLNISRDDQRYRALAHQIIREHVDELVAAFYDHLLRFPETARFLASQERIEKLRQALRQYLLTLGQGIDKLAYFEDRLRIGMTHERNGVALKWYMSTFSHLRALVTDFLVDHYRGDPGQIGPVLTSLQKIICLDTQLAVETYHRAALARVEALMQQLERSQDKIRKLAQTDPLTGLFNRRHFLDCLEAEIQRCRRYGHPLCLVMLDMDDFKAINDRFGHPFGDGALLKIAELLPPLVRRTDVCARIGGDELAVMLVETPQPTAILVAERIRLAILHTAFGKGQERLPLSVSIGIAEWTPDADVAALLHQADDALYKAKAWGKNCLRVAGACPSS